MKVVCELRSVLRGREHAFFLLLFFVRRNVGIMARTTMLNHKGEATEGCYEGSEKNKGLIS